MPDAPKPSAADLLKHFDEETAARLAHLVSGGTLSPAHLQELIRLTSARPDYRDPEELESLLEDAEDMDADAFHTWVDQLLKEVREE